MAGQQGFGIPLTHSADDPSDFSHLGLVYVSATRGS